MKKWLLAVLVVVGLVCLRPERETLPAAAADLGVCYDRLREGDFSIRLDYPGNIEVNVALVGDVWSWDDIPDRAKFLLAYHRTPICRGKWYGLYADGKISVIDHLPEWAGWSIQGTD